MNGQSGGISMSIGSAVEQGGSIKLSSGASENIAGDVAVKAGDSVAQTGGSITSEVAAAKVLSEALFP